MVLGLKVRVREAYKYLIKTATAEIITVYCFILYDLMYNH